MPSGSTRGMFSSKPPPVMWASALIGWVGRQRGQHVFHIQAGGLHDGLFEGLAVQRGGSVGACAFNALAHQAEAVGVHAAAGQAQHHVAGFHARRSGF
jgi:hypothetical protein